ncbi:MAG: BrnT family toxin [Planctomycetota bacterium]|nr:BrnT family toxin [Planctomycetota bacterium]
MNGYHRLAECTGFEWDEGNAVKNWLKHDVSQSECEQVFFNMPFLVKPDEKHSLAETRFYALGKTDAGRLLFIAFTIRGEKVRVISARDMTMRERRRYQP